MKPKPKRKPSPRQTSDRVSRIAAKVMARVKTVGGGARPQCISCYLATGREIAMMAASCLNQDQTKGRRK